MLTCSFSVLITTYAHSCSLCSHLCLLTHSCNYSYSLMLTKLLTCSHPCPNMLAGSCFLLNIHLCSLAYSCSLAHTYVCSLTHALTHNLFCSLFCSFGHTLVHRCSLAHVFPLLIHLCLLAHSCSHAHAYVCSLTHL